MNETSTSTSVTTLGSSALQKSKKKETDPSKTASKTASTAAPSSAVSSSRISSVQKKEEHLDAGSFSSKKSRDGLLAGKGPDAAFSSAADDCASSTIPPVLAAAVASGGGTATIKPADASPTALPSPAANSQNKASFLYEYSAIRFDSLVCLLMRLDSRPRTRNLNVCVKIDNYKF